MQTLVMTSLLKHNSDFVMLLPDPDPSMSDELLQCIAAAVHLLGQCALGKNSSRGPPGVPWTCVVPSLLGIAAELNLFMETFLLLEDVDVVHLQLYCLVIETVSQCILCTLPKCLCSGRKSSNEHKK